MLWCLQTVGAFLPETENDPIKTDLFEIQAKLTAESNVCQELLVTVFKKRKSIMTSAVRWLSPTPLDFFHLRVFDVLLAG